MTYSLTALIAFWIGWELCAYLDREQVKAANDLARAWRERVQRERPSRSETPND